MAVVSVSMGVQASQLDRSSKRIRLSMAPPFVAPWFLGIIHVALDATRDAGVIGTLQPGTLMQPGSADIHVALSTFDDLVGAIAVVPTSFTVQLTVDDESQLVKAISIARVAVAFDSPAAYVPAPAPGAPPEGRRARPPRAPMESSKPVARAAPVSPAAPSAEHAARATPGGGSEPRDLGCHFYAEMAARPRLARPTELCVTLSLEALQKVAGPTTQFASATLHGNESIAIIVRARNNCRILGGDSASLPPPKKGSPSKLVFSVQGSHEGPAELLVIARQGGKTLVTLVLQPQFVADIETLNASAAVSSAADEPPLVELRIYEDRHDGRFRLRFVLECRDLELNMNHVSEELSSDRDAYVSGLYERLEHSWRHERSDFNRFLARIRDLGGELYNELVPLEIRKVLWQHRDVLGAIEVISQEPFIPWEIAHLVEPNRPVAIDKTRFLGELGLVRWLDNLAWPPAQLSVAQERAWYVIPEYPHPDWQLPSLADERRLLEQQFRASPAPVESLELLNLIRDGSKVDLLHFACHGSANGSKIWDAGLMLQGRMDDEEYEPDALEVSQIKQNANFWERVDRIRPIVFLNACQAGRQGYTLAGVGGLAEAFLRRGAGLLVASLWSVGDKPALTFAGEFYGRLAAGDTVTRAVRHAREASKTGHEATFLAYCVYGHPYARLKVSTKQRADRIPPDLLRELRRQAEDFG